LKLKKALFMKIKSLFVIFLPAVLIAAYVSMQSSGSINKTTYTSLIDSTENSLKTGKEKPEIMKTEEEWKKELTPEQYYVLRKKGTERAFTGKYNNHKEKGMYVCAGCGNELFSSDTKYDSGCGWPSYWTPLAGDKIILKEDRSYGMIRTEVMCAKCGGHLGHVFEDGPEPTGLRYCINSVSLDFKKPEDKE
jgi:peptide-methionine (R)-S-oxide reductase